MLYLRSWLQDYINLNDYSNTELKDIITMKSGEVDEVKEIHDYFDGKVLIGKIENTRKHPDADRLKIFDVNLGDSLEKIQIVSAAPNVADGLIVPVATINTKLSMGTILERKMRGEISQGMCLGMSELMLETQFSSGLWELNSKLAEKNINPEEVLGQSICKILPEYFPQDTIYDIKYLADKQAACGNHLGLALEIAKCLEQPNLLTQKALQLIDPAYIAENLLTQVQTAENSDLKITVEDKAEFSRSFFLFDLKVTEEYSLPHELQKRMFLIEKNLIGGLADLSNYLLYDIGQPSHFYSKNKVLSRNSDSTEIHWTIEKLDAGTPFKGLGQLKNTTIPENIAVLTQNTQTLTILGVSGGESTKVDSEEKEVLIEVANFPASEVAKSSFALNYRSDGARIWASEVNPSLQFLFVARLIEVLNFENSEYKITNLLSYINPKYINQFKITQTENLLQKSSKIMDYYLNRSLAVDFTYLAQRIDDQGLHNWKDNLENKLNLIGNYRDRQFFSNIFYGRIETQEDLLDQLAPLVGFDKLEPDFLHFSADIKLDKKYDRIGRLKAILLDYGFYETITRPFVKQSDILDSGGSALKLLNPSNSNEPFIRDSLFSSLIGAAKENILLGEKEIKLFEHTKTYKENSPELEENILLEGIFVGKDPYALTSMFNEISKKTNTAYLVSDLIEPYLNLGQGFTYTLKNLIKISLVQINNKVKRNYELPLSKNIWYFSIDLTQWQSEISQYKIYKNESEFPFIQRSYSAVASKDLKWQEVLSSSEQLIIPDVEIEFKPIERITQDNNDVLNFDVKFVSYTRNLEIAEIEAWQDSFFKIFGDKLQLK